MSQISVDAASFGIVAAADCASCEFAGVCALNLLGVGCWGRVVSVGGDPCVRRRLMEMGFCNQARVRVVRRAPMGDPIEFHLRGYYLSLRHDEARHIHIEPLAA